MVTDVVIEKAHYLSPSVALILPGPLCVWWFLAPPSQQWKVTSWGLCWEGCGSHGGGIFPPLPGACLDLFLLPHPRLLPPGCSQQGVRGPTASPSLLFTGPCLLALPDPSHWGTGTAQLRQGRQQAFGPEASTGTSSAQLQPRGAQAKPEIPARSSCASSRCVKMEGALHKSCSFWCSSTACLPLDAPWASFSMWDLLIYLLFNHMIPLFNRSKTGWKSQGSNRNWMAFLWT